MMIRTLGLLAPVAVAAALWLWRRPERREAAGAFLSFAWTLPSLISINALALRAGWWSFDADGGLVLGTPGDLVIGWALLWGPAAALLRRPLWTTAIVALALDIALMPSCAPVVLLGPAWLVGEIVALAIVFVPAQLLAAWTRDDRHLAGRASLQAGVLIATAMFVFPAGIAEWTGWAGFDPIAAQIALLVGIPGLSAAHEFVVRGGGTPFPFDPPVRLVRSGPYRYVANPMQLSCSLAFVPWSVAAGVPALSLLAIASAAFSVSFAAWHEETEMPDRFAGWRAYRRAVRAWFPRWRPHDAAPARLYVAATCVPCRAVAEWFFARGPVALEIVPAEAHPSRDLCRITYDPLDGTAEEDGVAAVARALEHVNLAWALVGFAARLPLIRPVLQLLLDASGGGPRRIPRNPRIGLLYPRA